MRNFFISFSSSGFICTALGAIALSFCVAERILLREMKRRKRRVSEIKSAQVPTVATQWIVHRELFFLFLTFKSVSNYNLNDLKKVIRHVTTAFNSLRLRRGGKPLETGLFERLGCENLEGLKEILHHHSD